MAEGKRVTTTTTYGATRHAQRRLYQRWRVKLTAGEWNELTRAAQNGELAQARSRRPGGTVIVGVPATRDDEFVLIPMVYKPGADGGRGTIITVFPEGGQINWETECNKLALM